MTSTVFITVRHCHCHSNPCHPTPSHPLQVHPKLVNFMTPVELDAPQFAAQLFSNLFGGAKK